MDRTDPIPMTPRPPVQPTAQTDRQHLARLAQADRWAVLHQPESPVAPTVPLWRARVARSAP